ncbi:MAG: branched-chain amino acid aminotransferase [Flavobacteriales bacterium]|nr:branched-chain amino acid aminotransferase [Flavobacteriales bacterium]
MINIKYHKVPQSRVSDVDFNNLPFGKEFTDHMFIAEYDGEKWGNFKIQPYGPLLLSPSLSCMHYGQAIFEGMKVYRTHKDEVLAFRPLENHQRMNASAVRMCMPELSEEVFMEGLQALVNLDKEWVPHIENTSLYLRPFMIATDDFLGVSASKTYMFIIYGCTVGPYYTKPIKVKVETDYIRACKGGVGEAKTAGNYAAAMYATRIAISEGFNAVLWTDALEHKYVEELGTSNIFAVSGNKIITPETKDTILKGITRMSIITLARTMGYEVEERPLTVDEIFDKYASGALDELFATGTAATVTSICQLNHLNREILLPVKEDGVAVTLKNRLENIKRGKAEDVFEWTFKIFPTNIEKVMSSEGV